MKPRRDWTREELLGAMSLYCQIPFGQFHRGNPHVVALAAGIGRTPSAVAMKLSNLASLDPYHAARGVRGLAKASDGDRAVWAEFWGRWEDLAAATPPSLFPPAAAAPEAQSPHGPTEVTRPSPARRGQSFFRNAVLAAYDSACCITGVREPALLRAGHIRPWSAFPEARLDPRNGLCLNALHDAAFDRGLIACAADGTLLVSPRLRRTVPPESYQDLFARYAGRPIHPPDRFAPDPGALAYHRDHIYAA